MKLQLAKLPVPELEFGGAGYFHDPRTGLMNAGPFDLRFGAAHRLQVRAAIVGPVGMRSQALEWLERCKGEIKGPQSGGRATFPGFGAVFRSDLVVNSEWSVDIPARLLEEVRGMKPYEGFERLVSLYSDAIQLAHQDFRPDVVICTISKEIEERFWSVQRSMSPTEKAALKRVEKASLLAQLELPLDWEPEEEQEDLIRRDFRRALKARAMEVGVPIQLVRMNVIEDSSGNEDAATRAWNLSVGLYYKAGGIPWRVHSKGPETCFVGITFHHLRTTKRAVVHSALAQAFSTKGGGFALRGSTLEPERGDSRRTPHLSIEQARVLGERVLKEYVDRNGELPKRVVLHKSSRFSRDEEEGFRDALKPVPMLSLVALSPSSIRLVTHASYPPSRGTLLSVDGRRHFLFTSGYIPELGTYPGPHIPIPVELFVHGEPTLSEVREAAIDALGLGRLNWNSSDLRSSQPVTLAFARKVGGIMAEYGQLTDREPDPSYRFYM